MSQRNKVLIMCFMVAVTALMWSGTVLFRLQPTNSVRWEQEVTVFGHTVFCEKKTQELIIPKDGEGRFSVSWHTPDPGFITGILVRDPQGTPVFGVTGDIASSESTVLQLSAGSYTLETYLMTDEESYLSFGDMISANRDQEDGENQRHDVFTSQIIRDGTWRLELSAAFLPMKGGIPPMLQLALSSGLLGVFLGILLFTLPLKGRSAKRVYDERQELIRGRGYRLAFLTTAAYCGIMMILEISGVTVFMERAVELGIGALLGLCVHAVYCIRKDGYYGLNENIRKRFGIMTGLMVLNGLNIVFQIKGGGVFWDGGLTFHSLSVFLFLFLVIVLVSLTLRYAALVKGGRNKEDT